jgi:hypothetical protein
LFKLRPENREGAVFRGRGQFTAHQTPSVPPRHSTGFHLRNLQLKVSGIRTFYLVKNTPERKDYNMENLIVPVED